METDSYLLACQRYIELNPVRAALINAPDDYPWSSYRANALGAESTVVSPHTLYTALGKSHMARQTAYRSLFAATLSDNQLLHIRQSVNGGFVTGNARFAREIEAMLGRRTRKGAPGRPKKPLQDDRQTEIMIQ